MANENWRYTLFGLRLACDRNLPWLLPAEFDQPDLHIQFDPPREVLLTLLRHPEQTCYVGRNTEQGVPLFTLSRLDGGRYLRFLYCDGCQFVLDSLGSRLWVTYPPSLSAEYVDMYLLGPILGYLLRLRGVVCLHASAVAVDGEALVLVGTNGVGKSTTAAAFARSGHAILADDIVALVDDQEGFHVHPAFPMLRLWDDSAAALYGSCDALPLIARDWDKRFLDVRPQFSNGALPLGAIYLLGERTHDPRAPWFEAVTGHAALMALVSNTYSTLLLDQVRRVRELDVLHRVATTTRLQRVFALNDAGQLARFCSAIIDDFRARRGRRQQGKVCTSAALRRLNQAELQV